MSRVDVTSVAGWAQACSSAFVPLRARSAAPRFRASLQQLVLTPDVALTRVASGASEVYRSDRVIAEHPRDDVLISMHRTGTGSVTQHGRVAGLRAGSAALYDASSPYTLTFPARMSEVVLQLPRRCIPAAGHGFAELTARPLPEGGPLRALTALAVSVDPDTRPGHPLEDAAIADAMVSLIGAIVSAETALTAPRLDADLMRAALRHFIDDHLADPRLAPEFVAHAHHMSLRLVQKLFAQDGESPAAYIRRRRLESARRLLLGGEPVHRAGHLTGFGDIDTFSRAFKREFGAPPSSLRPRD
ncbi:MAG TPA: helix-turn-helix domain-containing protein [Streptosporangiaceae bacterium]